MFCAADDLPGGRDNAELDAGYAGVSHRGGAHFLVHATLRRPTLVPRQSTHAGRRQCGEPLPWVFKLGLFGVIGVVKKCIGTLCFLFE